MTDFFEELLDDLEAERRQGRSPSCLSDATLQALADHSLPTHDLQRAREHLNDCLSCLHSYAQFRSLLTESFTHEFQPESSRLSTREPWWALAWAGIRNAFTFRIPAGLMVATTVAAVLITWTITGMMQRSAGPFRPRILDSAGQPDELAQLSHVEGNQPQTVAGVVEQVRPAWSEGVDAYVVHLRAPTGAEYVILAWGRPSIRKGQTVEARGVFTNMTESGIPPTFKGVASQVRSSGSK